MTDSLKRTPLAKSHEALGARMVDFGGWYMPVQYEGLIGEHTTVRKKVGLFDVSHMGEFRVKGPDALAFLNYMTVNNVSKLADGQAHYTVLAYPNGTVVDDLLIYRYAEDHYLLVVNASNIDKDFEWVTQHIGDFNVTVVNESDQTAQIAIQGPLAETVLQKVCSIDLSDIQYYWFAETTIKDIPTLVSRTGYTGEDGFECYVPAEHAVELWDLLLEEGAEEGIQAAGLGARDTLRLEARMHLYGNDMDNNTTVLEAGLGWVTKLKKKCDFIGKDALKEQKAAGLTRTLVGFEMVDKGIARQGYPIVDGDGEIGVVTSGSHSPTLKKSIGLGYVPVALSEPGTTIHINIRNKTAAATVVKGPFYKRS